MNFRELDNILITAGTGCGAAECHGFLCGYLCVAGHLEEDVFKQYLFADATDFDLSTEITSMIYAMAEEVRAGLNSENFTLRLLLPDDNVSLGDRGVAFIQWCESFISGLGVGGLSGLDLLSVECREVIQDILDISRLDLDTIGGSVDEEERAFTELTEYVRMGAMLLHEELQSEKERGNGPEVLH